MAPSIKRDLYSEVTSRILAEVAQGAAPWVKPWSATPGQNVPQNAVSNRPYSGCNVILLWLTRGQGWPTPRFLTFKQAQEAGGSVRKGERGTEVYFVKQLRVTESKDGEAHDKLIPMMREHTVFNVAQTEGLPASIVDGKPTRVRNPDTRDTLANSRSMAMSGMQDISPTGSRYCAKTSGPSSQRRPKHKRRRIIFGGWP
jgi:antirestriction protein ArdC